MVERLPLSPHWPFPALRVLPGRCTPPFFSARWFPGGSACMGEPDARLRGSRRTGLALAASFRLLAAPPQQWLLTWCNGCWFQALAFFLGALGAGLIRPLRSPISGWARLLCKASPSSSAPSTPPPPIPPASGPGASCSYVGPWYQVLS